MLKRFKVEWSILSEEKDKEWPQNIVVDAYDAMHARKVIEDSIIEGNKFKITNVQAI